MDSFKRFLRSFTPYQKWYLIIVIVLTAAFVIFLPEMMLEKEEPDSLDKIAGEVAKCRQCRLCEKKRNVVPGMGVLNPDVLVIGEGPGGDEDIQGLPFVGKAGQYLDKWLDAIGLSRHTNCFILDSST